MDQKSPQKSTTYTVGEYGERPWGSWELLACGEGYVLKRIIVQPGQKLSLQKHQFRSEHWVVVGGAAVVTRDAEVVDLKENEGIFLPLGCVHRLENKGTVPLVLIEIQTGTYLGEDDIIRLDDVYGRS